MNTPNFKIEFRIWRKKGLGRLSGNFGDLTTIFSSANCMS